ncbi:hypothetical protein ACJ73_08117 [Blastomyces percursus]|uniref:Uncharacterized protein n=1 Tax=Blastomyces percursus TaxID=1658174 RepID=A0A1J9PW82_9EURO|nr:hypothetical protein ACJ73_08117 [Blastomyces percursus]
MRSLIKVHFGGSSSGGGHSYELSDRHASSGNPGGSRGWRKAQPDFNKLESVHKHCKTQIFSKASSSTRRSSSLSNSSEGIIIPEQKEQHQRQRSMTQVEV